MWRFVEQTRSTLADQKLFARIVDAETTYFDPRSPVVVARAPGRLDVMGGIAEFAGSLTLQWPLAGGTYVAVQSAAERNVRVRTVGVSGFEGESEVVLELDDLAPADGPRSFVELQALLRGTAGCEWAAYVAGVLPVLQRACGVTFTHGMRILIVSEVPAGGGLGSSAALTTATLMAVARLIELDLNAERLVELAHSVESRIVNTPEGGPARFAAALGERDELLALRCQPAELEPFVPLPPNVALWGVESGVRAPAGRPAYRRVRTAAFMGYRMMADRLGFQCEPITSEHVSVRDRRWGGYLANLAPSEWEMDYAERLPTSMSGAEFRDRFNGLTDPVSWVEPELDYPVRAATAHPIHEHPRVCMFRSLMVAGELSLDDLRMLGELMRQSHASYRQCGLSADGPDHIVELVRRSDAEDELYGARVTDCGGGGVVAILGGRRSFGAVQRLVHRYYEDTGYTARIHGGSSPGAMAHGVQTLAYVA